MRKSRRVDWMLLAVLLPFYVAMQAGGIQAQLSAGQRTLPLRLTGAQGVQGHPLVLSLRSPSSEIRPGDRVLRLGDLDLQGLSRAEIEYQTRPLLRDGRAFAVGFEREGERSTARLEPVPHPSWWWTIPVWLAFVLAGSFLLLRAPHWHLRRPFFVFCLAWAGFGASYYVPVPPLQVLAFVSAEGLAAGVAVWYVLAWDESARPGRGMLALSWAAGLALFGSMTASYLLTLSAGSLPYVLAAALGIACFTIYLAGMLRAYRRSEPLERRKLRWLFYAHFVAILPLAVAVAAREMLSVLSPELFSLAWLPLAAIPLGYAVAIVGYGWLDIDRVISATASVAILAVGLLGAALALLPRLAEGLSRAVGVDASVGQWALSLGVVGMLVPVHRSLRPWLDRRMFAEQHARMAGFETLLAELSACGSAGELTTLTGERLEALLAPESIATYAREGDLFTPIFVRGHAAPVAFPADGVLVRALEARTRPLAANDTALDAFDRAALTTLGAELVIPARRTTNLAAFTCLGRKRSGDIYTATERAVLSAVAHKIGERLAQLDAEDLARDTKAIQERLRRYVPGAVADELMAGRELEPEEREVSVLFVDLRGYTSFAEGRTAQDVFSTINEHTERVSRIVKAQGGTVVEFNGDGMMAVFGAPDELPNKERAAVRAGREVVEGMPAALRVGVGIATGGAVVGSIRSADRWIWSAVGNTTNLAARLQSLTRELDVEIAVDEATQRAAGYVCGDFERHENLEIRGRTGRFDVFALHQAPLQRPPASGEAEPA